MRADAVFMLPSTSLLVMTDSRSTISILITISITRQTDGITQTVLMIIRAGTAVLKARQTIPISTGSADAWSRTHGPFSCAAAVFLWCSPEMSLAIQGLAITTLTVRIMRSHGLTGMT